MTETQIKIQERADTIQEQMQEMITQSYESDPHTKASYNDFTTSYLISRIASLEVTLETLLKEKGNVTF